jgi:hypothetical protein
MNNRSIRILAACVVGLGAVLVLGAAAWRDDDGQNVCGFRNTEGLYGISCVGSLQPGPGAPFGPASMVGYIRGDGHGRFFGDISLNTGAPIGTIHEKIDGHATVDPARGCIGTVVYDNNSIEIAPGVFSPPGTAPKLTAEFAIIEDGHEILGLPVEPGQSGDALPRLACRLVKTRGH